MMRSTPQRQHHNLYYIITLITFGLVIVFSVLMLISFSVSSRINNTSVGYIYLGNASETRYDSVLVEGIELWHDQADYSFSYYGNIEQIPLEWLEFNVVETKQNIIQNEDNLAYFDTDTDKLNEWIQALNASLGDTLFQAIDISHFTEDIMQDAMSLSRLKTYELKDYLNPLLAHHVISEFLLDGLNESDIATITAQFSTWELQGETKLSLLDATKSTTLNNNQLSIIASGILNVIVDSHLSAIQYHIQQYLPIWANVGANVRILRLNLYDFTFYNGFDDLLLLTIDPYDEDTLAFRLVGYPYVSPYEHNIRLVQTIPYPSEIITNPLINDTTPDVIITETETSYIYDVVVQQGVNGSIYDLEKISYSLEGVASTYRVRSEHYFPITEVIHRHIVQKGG